MEQMKMCGRKCESGREGICLNLKQFLQMKYLNPNISETKHCDSI